jgi:D-alanine transaminase
VVQEKLTGKYEEATMIDTEQIVHLNGRFIPLADAQVSVLDRGFIYGDGVYELVPVYGREPFRLPHHLARLQRSMDGIGLANPHTAAQWEALIRDLIARQPFADQGVYLQVTRGVAKRDHSFPQGVAPTVFMMCNPLPLPTREQVERGVAVVTAEDNRWHRCDLKTISLLGNVLLRQLATEQGAAETVMFRDGFLTEASASNVLIVEDGTIIVPPKDNLILPGITYDATMEFAREAEVPLIVRPVTKAEALGADEMWLSSSTKEVLAVTTVDGKPFAGGKPGPVFRKLWDVFQTKKPRSLAAA